MDKVHSDPSPKVPNLRETAVQWVYKRLGLPGLIVVLILIPLAFYVWTHWDTIQTWPGVRGIVQILTRQSIPHADPNRFTVLVAHLETQNSEAPENEQILITDFLEHREVNVLVLDRTISLKGNDLENAERQGHDKARDYLKKSGAAVIIWGTVFSKEGSTVFKLFLDTLYTPAARTGRYKLVSESLCMPDLFWEDLAEILNLYIVYSGSRFDGPQGQYAANRLKPVIRRVQALYEKKHTRPDWSGDNRGKTLFLLANALTVLGEQTKENGPLQEAVASYRLALGEFPRQYAYQGGSAGDQSATHDVIHSLDWAITQYNLGNTLIALGKREKNKDRFASADEAYNAAMDVFELEEASSYIQQTQEAIRQANILLRQFPKPPHK